MLCGCGKTPATESVQNYRHLSTKTQDNAKDYKSRDRNYNPESNRKRGSSPGYSSRTSEVLMSDESYPGNVTSFGSGAWNPAFDSGIESGTLTFDSCNQSMDGMTLTHTEILERMRRSDSIPVLEFSEKPNLSLSRSDFHKSSRSILDSTRMTPSGKGKMFQKYQGQLKIAVYLNYGLLTVHIMEGRHFVSKQSTICNAYVKVSLTPDDDYRRAQCRTDVVDDSNRPNFDEKFSFELLEGDVTKRILISVWNRNPGETQSELLGCMSFGIQRIVEQQTVANGWYFLLSDHVGKRKHLHVTEKRRPLVAALNTSSCASLMTSTICERTTNYRKTACGKIVNLTLQRAGPSVGYGVTLTGGSPAAVFTVEPRSPADVGGLTTGHKILKVEGQDVSRATADTVARIIRYCDKNLTLEVHMCKKQPCCLEDVKLDDLTLTNGDLSATFTPRQATVGRSPGRVKRQPWTSAMSPVLSDGEYTQEESTLS